MKNFMLKSSFFLLISISLLSCSDAKKQNIEELKNNKFVLAEKVVEEFVGKYVSKEHITLVKNKDGYSIQSFKYVGANKTPIHTEKFWDIKTKSFLTLGKFEQRGSTNADQKVPGTRSIPYSLYNQNLYFGYKGWADDVVFKLGVDNKKQLSSVQLYQLYRAYNEQMSVFVGRDYFADPSIKPYDLTNKDKTIKGYLEIAKKLIATGEFLLEKDPEFNEGIAVGSFSVKHNNTLMDIYLGLCMMGESKMAKTYLNKVKYDANMLHFAKSLLSSCKQRAILRTGGDNDTYPLIYAQEVLGFRKDVIVFNTLLGELGPYDFYLLNKHKLSTVIDAKEYYESNAFYFGFLKGYRDFIPYEELLKEYKSFEFVSPLYRVKNVGFTVNIEGGGSHDIKKSFLSKSEIFMLDIWQSNNLVLQSSRTARSMKGFYSIESRLGYTNGYGLNTDSTKIWNETFFEKYEMGFTNIDKLSKPEINMYSIFAYEQIDYLRSDSVQLNKMVGISYPFFKGNMHRLAYIFSKLNEKNKELWIQDVKAKVEKLKKNETSYSEKKYLLAAMLRSLNSVLYQKDKISNVDLLDQVKRAILDLQKIQTEFIKEKYQ